MRSVRSVVENEICQSTRPFDFDDKLPFVTIGGIKICAKIVEMQVALAGHMVPIDHSENHGRVRRQISCKGSRIG